ncbi:hypothetical protein D3C84_743960 [compost metagenome]
MPLIQAAHLPCTDDANEDSVGDQTANEAQNDQPRQHRPMQQFRTTGQQRRKSRHRHRIGFGIGQTEQNAVPERLPRRALRHFGAAAFGPHCAQTEPEQIEPAEHAQHVKRGAADFPRTDNRDQRGAAPNHVPEQMPAQKACPCPSPTRCTNTEHRQNAGPGRDAVDKARGENGHEQRWGHREILLYYPVNGRKSISGPGESTD